MGRLKQLEERKTAPCLNQRAARSFVRNALWEPKEQQRSGTSIVSLLIIFSSISEIAWFDGYECITIYIFFSCLTNPK